MFQTYKYTNQNPRLTFTYIKQQFTLGYEIATRLLQRNIAGAYRQSWLGFAWLVISPFTTVATFIVLNMSGVVVLKDIPVPYPIFGLLSVSLWHLFYNTFIQVTDSLLTSGGLILKVKFPKESIIFSDVGQVLVDFFIKTVLIIITFVVYLRAPSIYAIFTPILLLPLIFLGTGLGMIASILNIIFRDVRRVLSIFLGFFLYLMPIMYVQPPNTLLWTINRFNPLFYLITIPREIILQGKISSPHGYIISVAFSLLVFWLGWAFFVRTSSRVVERI